MLTARAFHRRLFTGGDDYLVRILPCQIDSPLEPLVIDDATKAITWVDADADYLVTGSEDGCVRIYQHSQPVSEMESQMTSPTDLVCLLARSSLAVRCVVLEKAVSPGKTPRVAICSDELAVKVVDAGDPKRVQLLTGHSRGLRAASWHPLRPQLVTTSCDGSIRVWDLSSTEPACVKTLESVLPVSSSTSEQTAQAIYHPSGEYFVLPSKTHELVVISTSDYRKTGSFVVGQGSQCATPMGEVSSFAFSANGRYLASATTDGKVTVWESETRQAIRSISRQSIKTGLSWHPTMNALAWTDTMGQLCRWNDVVGSKYPSPCEYVEYLPASQLKQRQQRDEIDDLFGDIVPDDEEFAMQEAPKVQPRTSTKPSRGGHEVMWTSSTKSQPTFQPTSTPMRSGRRYMCLNMIGSLMSIDQDEQQSISFESHDSNARRNWRFVDHFGYNMATIGSTGALFACPSRKGEGGNSSDEDEDEEMAEHGSKKKGRPSSIYFKPFEAMGAWTTSGSEWSLDLAKGEDAVCVAIGGYKAKVEAGGADNVTAIVATSSGYLRFFSASGMQRYIWALGCQVVSMAAGRRFLLVVHRGNSGAAMDKYQNLSYTVIDLTSFAVRQEGTLPLGKDATLTWLGFNEMDFPAIYDSRQILYILDRCLGAVGQARWVPVLDASAESNGAVKFWPVGLDSSNLMTVFLKGNSLAYPDPTLSSRPLIQEVKLKMPLLNQNTPTGALEEQHLKNIQMASFIRAYQASLAEEDDESQEILANLGSASALEHESDKALLQLVQLSCKSDKHQRVLDAARELHGTRTLDAALQIGAFFHLSSLVDRMSGLRDWVASRKERDEQMAWSGVSAIINDAPQRTDARILVGNSQSPLPRQGEDSRSRKAALTRDFAVGQGRKSYGDGGKSELAKLGASPASTWAINSTAEDSGRHSDKENNDEGDQSRGQKRRARDGDEEGSPEVDTSASESEARRSGESRKHR